MLTYASGAAAASEQAERQRTHEHAVRMQADRNAPRAVTTAPLPPHSPLPHAPPHAPPDASAEAAACAGGAVAATSKAERWKQRAQQQVQHRPAACTRSGGSSASSTAAKGLLQ